MTLIERGLIIALLFYIAGAVTHCQAKAADGWWVQDEYGIDTPPPDTKPPLHEPLEIYTTWRGAQELCRFGGNNDSASWMLGCTKKFYSQAALDRFLATVPLFSRRVGDAKFYPQGDNPKNPAFATVVVYIDLGEWMPLNRRYPNRRVMDDELLRRLKWHETAHQDPNNLTHDRARHGWYDENGKQR